MKHGSMLFTCMLLCLLWGASTGYAQQPLSLERAFQLALLHNPDLEMTHFDTAIADAEILKAKAFPNPVLLSDNGIAEDTYRIGIEQTIPLGGKRKHRLEIAQIKKEQAQHAHQQHQLTIRHQVRRAYTQLYIAQQRLLVFQQFKTHPPSLPHTVQTVKEKLQLAELNRQYLLSQTDAEQAQYQLNYLLGQPLETPWQLLHPPVDIYSKADFTVAGRPAKPLTLRLAEAEVKAAQAERIPNLILAAGPDMVFGDTTDINAFIIAAMEIPLFNRQQGEIRAAKTRQAQLQTARQSQERQRELEIRQALKQLEVQQQIMAQYQPFLFASAQAKKTSFTHQDLLMRLELRKKYDQALSSYQEAIGTLEQAAGQMISSSIKPTD